MIAKITHGRSAVRALAYDHGPGRADEHVHPRKVGGNVPGRDWQQRAQRMQRFVTAHQHDPGDRGVYRVALANPDTDRVLSDREWRTITEKFVNARTMPRDTVGVTFEMVSQTHRLFGR